MHGVRRHRRSGRTDRCWHGRDRADGRNGRRCGSERSCGCTASSAVVVRCANHSFEPSRRPVRGDHSTACLPHKRDGAGSSDFATDAREFGAGRHPWTRAAVPDSRPIGCASQRRPLELAPILAQAMESVEPLLRDKRHKVVVTSCFEPLFVNGDSARLVQCIANLLTHAAKYTDSSGEIRVELRGEEPCAVIVVTDNGVGISPELLPRIFELFVQSERSLDRSEGGLGIGLSVVQRLVEMHDGQVVATSAGPGRGSTFEIRLPTVAAPKEGRKKSTPRSVAPKRALVVADNVAAATSLAAFLQLDGHQAEAVYSAKDALEAIATFGPDVVLLDIGLPEMDGYEVAKRIRAGGSCVRLIALTGYGQAEDIERTHLAGFDAHLVKPVDFVALERSLSGKDAVPGRA